MLWLWFQGRISYNVKLQESIDCNSVGPLPGLLDMSLDSVVPWNSPVPRFLRQDDWITVLRMQLQEEICSFFKDALDGHS